MKLHLIGLKNTGFFFKNVLAYIEKRRDDDENDKVVCWTLEIPS
jgi:hypothetical protein